MKQTVKGKNQRKKIITEGNILKKKLTYFFKEEGLSEKRRKRSRTSSALEFPQKKRVVKHSLIVSVLLTWNLQFICSPLLST